MKQHGIIVSSKALLEFLKQVNTAVVDKEQEVLLECFKGELSITMGVTDKVVYGETWGESWEVRISYKRIDALTEILRILSEQPVTLYFQDQGWVTIACAVI